ncbi:MAG TPA: hypothetical protein VK504_30600 [Vicinamibacterales bacterium]|jgi:hypothetical protein|nr:hypothetical protein [Vicinamibacterales bacterium]
MNVIRTVAIVAVAVMLSAPNTNAQADKVNVTGKWLFNVETGAGSGTPTMTFTQDGEKLTGKYNGQFGDADLTGTVKGQDIAFSFNVDAQGTALTFKYTGTIENKDALKGKVDIAGLGEGTFTAKRQ